MPAETATLQLHCALGQTRFPTYQTLRWHSLGQVCHDCFRRNGAVPAPSRPAGPSPTALTTTPL